MDTFEDDVLEIEHCSGGSVCRGSRISYVLQHSTFLELTRWGRGIEVREG